MNVLDGVQDDIRTPDKLVDGVNDTMDGGHMWLAPILPGMVSSHVIVSKIKLLCTFPLKWRSYALWNFGQQIIARK